MKYIKCGNERSFEQEKETKKIVEDIINKIRLEKDVALWELSKKFDEIKRESFHITQKEIKEAYNLVDSKIINAIEKAHENIKNFALLQKESQKTISENRNIQRSLPFSRYSTYRFLYVLCSGRKIPSFFNGSYAYNSG